MKLERFDSFSALKATVKSDKIAAKVGMAELNALAKLLQSSAKKIPNPKSPK